MKLHIKIRIIILVILLYFKSIIHGYTKRLDYIIVFYTHFQM